VVCCVVGVGLVVSACGRDGVVSAGDLTPRYYSLDEAGKSERNIFASCQIV
jgi:hypothetical protein